MKELMSELKKYSAGAGFFLVFSFVFSLSVAAETMKSENYKLQMGQFNMFGGQKSSESYKLVDTGGQLGPGIYTGEGYVVRSGFLYFKKIAPFTFSISDALITFEGLTANNWQIEKSTLTVNMGSARSYKVEGGENHPLLNLSDKKTIIADFSGDNGKCTTPIKACSWVVSSTYGFGYNLRGDDVVGFEKEDYFKQFADLSDGEVAAELMENGNTSGKREAVVSYKINISKNQKTGVYENTVLYTAIPGY